MNQSTEETKVRDTLAALVAKRAIPASTYRLQFHKGFTFRDAAAVVPYLSRLGVTHCYASPYLKATPGSTHGYDVVDHTQLNPELGTRADFDAWLAAMRNAGMSHILDTVPNHMGVGSDDNRLWTDLLEDGPLASHGHFFDVAWSSSPRPELKDRILLPTLGEPYGTVLEKGDLRLERSPNGGFAIAYYDRHFPVSVATYDAILDPDSQRNHMALEQEAADALRELKSIIDATRNLVTEPNERHAQKQSIKSRLRTLLEGNRAVSSLVDANIATLNGKAEAPHSYDGLHALITRQNYRLAYWRTASDEINYRRFFDVTTLAALAMEREAVFEEAHRLIFELIGDGHISGLRIDHSDGLYDPKEYFLRLQRRALLEVTYREKGTSAEMAKAAAATLPEDSVDQPLYVVTEKILAPGEPLPKSWAMAGTSGYDILNEISGLFVDPSGERGLDACYRNFAGPDVEYDYHELAYRKKRQILTGSFAGELNLLAHQLDRLAQGDRHSCDYTLDVLRDALTETIACFSVYRTYVTDACVSDRDVEVIDTAIGTAKQRDPSIEPRVFDFLRDLLSLRGPLATANRDAVVHFAGKFQQLTSPVTAKGLEDTAFYTYHRLTSLNEVGGEPARFGVSAESLHTTFAARQREWPTAMSVLSTHDTKRAEDVRARIHVLSELAEEWTQRVGEWRAINRAQDVHPNDEYLLYQTLIGAWPLGAVDEDFVKRINAYMLKALREAKERTSWTAPNDTVEKAASAFIGRILDAENGREFREAFLPFQQRVARVGMVNSLAQTLLRLTAPGIPDTYQGTELWDLSLVDPDNRRPVDYAHRNRLLDTLDAASPSDLIENWPDGRIKLLVTSRALRYRRSSPALFSKGAYVPLSGTGLASEHVFAFARMLDDEAALVIVPRLMARLADTAGRIDWKGATLTLPSGLRGSGWSDVLTGHDVGEVNLTSLLKGLPVALLKRGRRN